VSARIVTPWNEYIREGQWKVLVDELFHKGMTARSILKSGKIVLHYLLSLWYHPEFSSGIFTPELQEKRFTNLPLQPAFTCRHDLRKRHGEKYRKRIHKQLSERQWARIMLDHVPQRMEYCYAAAAQYGIEYRYPLLDVDLMQTCLALPPWLKQHHGINRYIFRQAIKGFVPEAIRNRDDKSGTTIPHMHYSLLNEKDKIMDLVKSFAGSAVLKKMMNFERFEEWYEKLARRDKDEINYLNPGAFYDYLMIMIYFKDHD
jgi:hypothetical protein